MFDNKEEGSSKFEQSLRSTSQDDLLKAVLKEKIQANKTVNFGAGSSHTVAVSFVVGKVAVAIIVVAMPYL